MAGFFVAAVLGSSGAAWAQRPTQPMAILRTLQTTKTQVNPHVRPDAHISREFVVGGNPIGITEAFDNAFFYTDVGPASLIGKISFDGRPKGRVPTTTPNSAPNSIAKGPDGNCWFLEFNPGNVASITPRGTITEYNIPGTGVGPNQIVAGPDGNMWFTTTGNTIGTINVKTKVITQYPLTAFGYVDPNGIVSDRHTHSLYFTGNQNNTIYRITTLGAITPLGVATGVPADLQNITIDGDELWFAEGAGNKIGRITTRGSLKEYTLPTGSSPHGIVIGFHDNVYFANSGNNTVGKLSAGRITEYATAPGAVPVNIVQGPADQLWFTEVATGAIGVFLQDH
jgi:virginiamycin B lyase